MFCIIVVVLDEAYKFVLQLLIVMLKVLRG